MNETKESNKLHVALALSKFARAKANLPDFPAITQRQLIVERYWNTNTYNYTVHYLSLLSDGMECETIAGMNHRRMNDEVDRYGVHTYDRIWLEEN